LLWPGGGCGSDDALAQVVLKLRQSLGDAGRALVTVRGRGYRLGTEVETLACAPAPVRPVTVAAPPSAIDAPQRAAANDVAPPSFEPRPDTTRVRLPQWRQKVRGYEA